jgi:hypothetical protein
MRVYLLGAAMVAAIAGTTLAKAPSFMVAKGRPTLTAVCAKPAVCSCGCAQGAVCKCGTSCASGAGACCTTVKKVKAVAVKPAAAKAKCCK